MALLSDLLGQPTEQKPGSRPSARWLHPSGAALSVADVGTSCSWGLRSPEFVEIEADLSRR